MRKLDLAVGAALLLAFATPAHAAHSAYVTGDRICVQAPGVTAGSSTPVPLIGCGQTPAYALFTDAAYGGSTSNTAAQNDLAAAAVRAACNSGALKGLMIPGGSYSFSANNPFNLTAPVKQCNIGGIGPSTVLVAYATGSLGTWFTCDGIGGNATGCAFHDLTLQWNDTQTPGTPALLFGASSDGFAYNITFNNGSEFAQFGTATGTASRIKSSGWTNNFNNGGNENCNICIFNATGLTFTSGNLNGAVISDTNPNGAFVLIAPVAGALVDTVAFDSWWMQSGLTHGKPYGVYVDCTNGSINNLTFNNAIFDWTTRIGVYEGCPASGVGYIHVQNWTGSRITPGSGPAVVFDVNDGFAAERIQFTGTHLFTRDGSDPFQVLAAHDGGTTKYLHDDFDDGDVEDTGALTTAAFDVGADGWEFQGVTIGRYEGGTTGFRHVFNVTNAAVNNLVVGSGHAASTVDWILEPTYTAVGSITRQIWRPRAARTVASGTTDTATVKDLAIRWNSATSGAKSETLPGCTAALDGFSVPVIDEKGTAGTNAIVMTPTTGTILGASSYSLNTNNGVARLSCDGNTTNWVLQ